MISVFVVCLVLVGVGYVAANLDPQQQTQPNFDEQNTHTTNQKTKVSLDKKKIEIGGIEIKVELAETSKEKARGLSNRDSLPEDQGMLFVNETPKQPLFWMKDMNFAIDIIWIDENLQVVGVEENVSPDSFPETFQPSEPVKYILEVNAGFAEKNSISKGATVDLLSLKK